MVLGWFNARAAEQVGTSLADQFAPKAASGPSARGNTGAGATDARKALAELLR